MLELKITLLFHKFEHMKFKDINDLDSQCNLKLSNERYSYVYFTVSVL